jgi:hypothetical protein
MCRLYLFALTFIASTAFAGSVVHPGDLGLRHDIQVLADYGVISGPTTTWPISWDAVAADLQIAVDSKKVFPNAVEQTLQRVMGRANRAMVRGRTRMNGYLSVAENPSRIQSFSRTPREEGEVSAGFSWLGERLSLDLNVVGAYEPLDDKEARPDGSRIAVDWGNVTLAVSTMDRWWGPGWDGSLILSNNARPIPALTIGRNRTYAFNTKWLSWLGPWDLETIFGQMEEERAVPNARFFGMRFVFRPTSSLEIGLSRTAQWCGDNRPCGFDVFTDLFLGKDNIGDAGTTGENEPGNQLGGFDLRWSNMWFDQPSAFYLQAIGEDEAGGLPSRYLGLAGIETSGFIRSRWSYRWFAEWAGTSCNILDSDPGFGCAYNHTIYETGYRYRGRAIGHGAEGDARIVSSGLLFVRDDETQWSVLLRTGDLNRGSPDARNTLTPIPIELSSIDLTYGRSLSWGRLELGVGYEQLEDPLTSENSGDARAFLTWHSH